MQIFWTILDKDKEFMSKWQPNSRETGKRTCRGVVSFTNDPFPRILHQQLGAQRLALMIPRGSRASHVGLLFIFSSRKSSSLILGGLLEVPICINEKALSLSRLDSS